MTMIDPECKMEPGEMEAKFKAEYKGNYYCNLSDKKKFGANPKKYLES